MSEAVVFQGLNTLEFQEIRLSVVRIPEVSQRIIEVQRIWDSGKATQLDLFNFIVSENQAFMKNICLKSLVSAVVQVGLFDRYLRYNQKPGVLAGNSSGDSALKVAAGVLSFAEMVFQSAAFKLSCPLALLPLANQPTLSGISLAEYGAYSVDQNKEGKVSTLEVTVDKTDPTKMISTLVEELDIRRFVNIGPGNLLYPQLEEDLRMADIQVLESIDLDPMLSWFWPSVGCCDLVMAQ